GGEVVGGGHGPTSLEKPAGGRCRPDHTGGRERRCVGSTLPGPRPVGHTMFIAAAAAGLALVVVRKPHLPLTALRPGSCRSTSAPCARGTPRAGPRWRAGPRPRRRSSACPG